MKRHTANSVITEALGQLDPAPRSELTQKERDHADTAFARIVEAPIDETMPGAPVQRSRRRRGLLLATLGLGATGAAIPGLLLGGNAYGSWTPTPEPLTAAAADEAATTCRAALGVPDGEEPVLVAERRGDWTYVLVASAKTEAICLMPDDSIGRDPDVGGNLFGSYDADAPAPPTLDPTGFDEATSMEGSTDEGWFIWSEGYVGSDVTGVTVHTSSGLDIEASVVGERFAAWWPSKKQSSDRPAETWSYTVHMADGSTRPSR